MAGTHDLSSGDGFDVLRGRIEARTARVCVFGQGYVGLSLACAAASRGMTVHGVDTDDVRVAGLRAGDLVTPGVREADFRLAHATGRLHFGTDPSVVADSDVIVICVPTPVTDHVPDLSHVEAAAREIAHHLRGGLVILESTTYAGTTEELVRPVLEGSGLRAGEGFLLAYSPERIDPGSDKYHLENTPRIVGGVDERSGAVAGRFYEQLVDDVHVLTDARTAELAKLLENTFRMVNIALVNELAMVCAKQGIDVWEVVAAAATKPFGFMPFHPGPGVGGHCIPLDPQFLAWRSRQVTGRRFRLVELAQDINSEMPEYVAGRVTEILNHDGRATRGARILALGVTYKPDVGDVRESAAVHVLRHLVSRGADVRFHDPFVERLSDHGLDLVRVPLDADRVEEADLVLLLTPHADYDLDWLLEHASLLLDVRNVTGPLHHPERHGARYTL
jgi:UDP-N-acetyl-D-glucosamine dehydrogenase